MQQRLSNLIEHVYLAAVDPSRWLTFLESLIAATESRSARLLVLNGHADEVTSSLKINIDDGAHRAYVDYYVNTCPWRLELAHKPGGRLYSTYLDFSCRQPQFYRTEFFNDWAGPQDIHHGVCGTVYADGSQTVQLLIQRTEGQGHYSREETAAVNALLVPHLQRSVMLSREAELARSRTEAAIAAAQSRALPFVLLDEHGCVEHVTPEAAALIAASAQLELREARLRVLRAAADARLRRLIMSAAGAMRDWAGAGGTLALPREHAPPLALLVTPLHPDAPGSFIGGRRAFAAVFFHDPAARIEVDTHALVGLYGLTAAEARVAAGVALGKDPATLASSLGVSAHTVRSQLKSAFRKTGAARQTELARLVLTGPACRRKQPRPLVLDGVGSAGEAAD